MNGKSRSILTSLAALGCFALPAQAVPAFSEIDRDKDGFISATESTSVPGLLEQMIVLDENADAKLSAEEFAVMTIIPTEQGISTEEEGAGEPSI